MARVEHIRPRQQVLPEWLSPKEAARLTGLSAKTILRYGAAKEIVVYQVGRRKIISVDSLRAFIEKRRCNPLTLITTQREAAQ